MGKINGTYTFSERTGWLDRDDATKPDAVRMPLSFQLWRLEHALRKSGRIADVVKTTPAAE
jgi:hypothetical protein